MENQLDSIFQFLDLNCDNGLVMSGNLQNINIVQKNFFIRVHEKLSVDAVYFLRDEDGNASIPLIYFASMLHYDTKRNAELHRLSWNLGEAPLLFIVTPTNITIYDNYKTPQINQNKEVDPRSGLIEELNLTNGLVSQYNALKKYHRSRLESGEYWRTAKKRFNPKGRVDTTLLANLKTMRRELIKQISDRERCDEGTIGSAVNALLCRSIFIKYLEERKGRNGQHVFRAGFYGEFKDSAEQYTDILEDKEATYRFFHALKDKFNGDILKDAEYEQDIITQDDLDMLRIFLTGSYEKDGQMVLWRLYSFDVIPIQLISSIYETFYHLSAENNDTGTYYTPAHLVSMLMDEVYPWEGDDDETSFLDPSCGSGIFLVEAYRRVVCRWMHKNGKETATGNELGTLLAKYIFGVDINGEAIRVAAFSLYLTMCDFLDPSDIWDGLVFPSLIGENLSEKDFFDESGRFHDRKYDIVIGNPPWQSTLTENAVTYLKKQNKVIGDKQMAQAFSIKCPELCKEEGVICLVMPGKGMLFNRSETTRKYRKHFFADNTVLEIINLALYKNVLFEHAKAPAAAVIYTPCRDNADDFILYCTPKPVYTFEDTGRFSIEPADICKIPREAVSDDKIWKIAMLGTPRDLELIKKIEHSHGTVADFIEKNGMVVAEGFKKGNMVHQCDDFRGLPQVTAKAFIPYYVERKALPTVDFNRFERTVSSSREIFRAPHLILKQSPEDGTFLSSVLDYDAVFNHSLLGIHGEMEKLKYLSIVISSDVFSYYHILTSGRWLVERSELEKEDIMQTPIPNPDVKELEEAVRIFDDSARLGKKAPKTEEFVRSVYGLNKYEYRQVDDVIHCVYDAITNGQKSDAFKKPDADEYSLYYETLRELLKNAFGIHTNIVGNLFSGDAPLSVLMLNMGEDDTDKLCIIPDDAQVNKLLSELERALQDECQMIYVRKNLRIYKSDAIYIIKPSQRKYWTYSSACRDGDEIFKDISSAWRRLT